MKVDVKRVGHDAEGIAYDNKKPIFIYYAYKNEKVEINLKTNKRGSLEGELLNVIEPSPHRIKPECPYYGICGGCNLMHINYEESLNYKKDKIEFLVRKRLNNNKDIHVENTIASNDVLNYRNKVDIPLRYTNGRNVMGLFHRGSIRFLEIDKCIVQNENINKLIRSTLKLMDKHKINAYDNRTNKGYITHLSIRSNLEGEMQIAFIVKRRKDLSKLIKEVTKLNPSLISVYESYVPNLKSNRELFDGTLTHIYGDTHLTMKLNEYKFLLTPNAFFQLNTKQAITLYETIIEKGSFKKSDIVLDAYCGVGTIGTFISKHVKIVVSIESVKDSVRAMDESLKINKIDNIRTITGDVIKASARFKYKFDIMVFDPPRVGLGKEMINYILKTNPREVIYVSCNPESLIEDLNVLTKQYQIKSITPLDMFPQTSQTESITVLTRIK